MGIWDGYDPTKEPGSSFEKGDYRVKLTNVEQKLSTNNNEMLAFEFHTVDGKKLTMTITEGEYFSAILNGVLDGLGIPRGNMDLPRWIGRTGTAYVDLQKPKRDQPDKKLYMEIKYFHKPTGAADPYASRQPASQPAASTGGCKAPVKQPEYAAQTRQETVPPDFPDEIPF